MRQHDQPRPSKEQAPTTQTRGQAQGKRGMHPLYQARGDVPRGHSPSRALRGVHRISSSSSTVESVALWQATWLIRADVVDTSDGVTVRNIKRAPLTAARDEGFITRGGDGQWQTNKNRYRYMRT